MLAFAWVTALEAHGVHGLCLAVLAGLLLEDTQSVLLVWCGEQVSL